MNAVASLTFVCVALLLLVVLMSIHIRKLHAWITRRERYIAELLEVLENHRRPTKGGAK